MDVKKYSYKIISNDSWIAELSDLVAGKVIETLCPPEHSDWAGYPFLEILFAKINREKDGEILEIGPGNIWVRFLSHLWRQGCSVSAIDVLDLSITKEKHPDVEVIQDSWEYIHHVYPQLFRIIYHHRIGPQLNNVDKFGPTDDKLEGGGFYIWCKRWWAATPGSPIDTEIFIDHWYIWGILRVERASPDTISTDKGYDITIMKKHV